MEKSLYTYRVRKVSKVVDGDTVYLLIDLGFHTFIEVPCRLLGVDTPEIYHPRDEKEKKAGLACKEFLKSLLASYPKLIVKTYKDKTGKYGRYLVEIFGLNPLDDKWDNINRLMNEYMIANRFRKEDLYAGK